MGSEGKGLCLFRVQLEGTFMREIEVCLLTNCSSSCLDPLLGTVFAYAVTANGFTFDVVEVVGKDGWVP